MLEVGSLALNPEFASGVYEYSATTTNASEAVTAVADDETATVSIVCGEQTGDSGDSFNLEMGENEIVITVDLGGVKKEYTVAVTRTEEPDLTLSALTIGALTLTPAFDPDVTEYTLTTSNATNTITATATDPNATVTILVGEQTVESGTSVTWETGENAVAITVTNGESNVYTVTVTKGE